MVGVMGESKGCYNTGMYHNSGGGGGDNSQFLIYFEGEYNSIS